MSTIVKTSAGEEVELQTYPHQRNRAFTNTQDDIPLVGRNDIYSTTYTINEPSSSSSSSSSSSTSSTSSSPVSASASHSSSDDSLASQTSHDHLSYPDGGLRAYSVTLGSFLGLIVNLGLLNSIGALQTYISRNQLSSLLELNISWIFAVYLSLTYAGGLISGPIFDRRGPMWLLVASTLLIFAGLMGAASSVEIWHFILSFFSLGVGNGLGMGPLIGVVSHWFERNRGINTGLATCGGSLGAMVFPLMLRSLYVKIGYVWAVRVLAFICITCMVGSILLVKERFRKVGKVKGSKDDEGEEEEEREEGDDEYVRGQGHGQGHGRIASLQRESKTEKLINSLKKMLRIGDYRFLFLIVGSFFAELSLVLLLTYFASYSIAQGASESTSYLLLVVWNATGIFGRFIPGYIGDHYGMFNINLLMNIGYMLLILVLLLPFGPKSRGVLWTFAGLGGFCSGSILSLLPTCLFQITPVNELGKKYGIVTCLMAIGNLFGIPIAAAIIGDGSQQEYNHFMVFVGVLALSGTVFWYFSRTAIVGLKLNVKV